jgi:K+-sensing histidine kinase KdpD
MEMIIYELLENSKKFHPHETPNIQIHIEPRKGNNIQVRFLDDGQLMSPEQITRAKMPYSQGEKWFTGELPGMGLGIPLVSALVWQTGGQVRITNRDDQVGVCVSLTLQVI